MKMRNAPVPASFAVVAMMVFASMLPVTTTSLAQSNSVQSKPAQSKPAQSKPAQSQAVTVDTEKSTQLVIADQINAFRTRDYDRAFSHAAPTIQKIFRTTDNFIAMVRGGYSPLYDPDNYIFGRNLDLDGTIHQEVIATDKQGKQWQAVYTLRQQKDGSWKITGVEMEPYKGAAT